MLREAEQRVKHGSRHDHKVYLDRSWAERLGARKTAGMYQIGSRDLLRRLSQENVGIDLIRSDPRARNERKPH